MKGNLTSHEDGGVDGLGSPPCSCAPHPACNFNSTYEIHESLQQNVLTSG